MSTAHFRFYAELNDFLPVNQRFREVQLPFQGAQTVKHLVESLGVPHTEIDLILVNGESVDFAYRVQHEDRISVYPVFEGFEIGSVNHLRPAPLRNPTFVLDVHLGRLAAYLRLLGFDAIYQSNYDDEEIARISHSQHRICLTRDRGLLKRKQVTHGYCLRSTDSRQQLREVLQRFDLHQKIQPFSRCARCNGLLQEVEKQTILNRLQEGTQQYYDDFWQCKVCGQVYWQGSHFQRLEKLIDWALTEEDASMAGEHT